MLLDIYKDALEYAAQDYKSLLKLGLCVLFSFLIIPMFIALGYEYKILNISTKGMIGGDEGLPEFNDLSSMFVDGLKVFAVNFVYMLIPIIVAFMFNFTSGGVYSINAWFGNGIWATGVIVTLIVFVLFYFISLMAVANMVFENGSIKAAFDLKGLWKIINNIGWIRYILFYIAFLIIECVLLILTGVAGVIIQIVFGFIGAVVGVLPFTFILASIIVTLIFSLLVQPFVLILKNRALGLLYEPLNEEV